MRMYELIKNIEQLSVVLIIFFAGKKFFAYMDFVHQFSKSNGVLEQYEDCNVYKAAVAFANGASNQGVKEMMLQNYQFNEDKINQILILAQKNITKMDEQDELDDAGLANAFIDAVNESLGENVYYLDSPQKS
ncbi:hypothetical protein J2Z32_003810 [Paenibacillus turicensis]|uniref:Uncharacterized protein n=1 Tax=Paenibacillus turicensis TaxID=160487 RepID=A0ABS4FX35_9BACL|nr:hypothetical protein [Paenibacillus turicensis]MBP1907145.1 hypothetical protein [Paenibacillus turicensis]